jgi:hypothetical protein
MAVRFADVASTRSLRRSGSAGTAGLAAGSAGALAGAVAPTPRGLETGPVVCPFRLATGLPCPGCGLTRSWVYIAHGDFGDALRANPFGYLTMTAAVALIVLVAVTVVLGRPVPSLTPVVRSKPFFAVIGGWLVFAAVRIAVVATG